MVDLTVLPSLNYYHENIPVGAATNWQAVAYPSSGAYVRGSIDGTYTTDIYEPVHPYILGTVTNVRISYAAKATTSGHHSRPLIRMGETNSAGTAETVPGDGVWRTYVYDWAVNPITGQAWTDDNILNLLFGVQQDHSGVQITEVRLLVTYTPTPWGTLYAVGAYTIFQRWILQSSQTLEVSGNITCAALHNQPLVSGVDCVIAGSGTLSGGYTSSDRNLIELAGTCEVRGTDSTHPLIIERNLNNGLLFFNPTNCLCQDVVAQDCRSGTSSTPVLGNAAIGVPILFYGPGSGNIMRRCTIKRGGLHGFQFYGSSNNLVEDVIVDGVAGYFGGSFYQSNNSIARRVTFSNTRREGFNAMQCVNPQLLDFGSKDSQTDYGISFYQTEGGAIQRGYIYRSWKDGVALVAADNCQLDHVYIDDPARGRFFHVGHYSGIVLEGADNLSCDGNVVENCFIWDKGNPKLMSYGIQEGAYMHAGVNLTDNNIIRNNYVFGNKDAPVKVMGSGTVATNNGII